MRLNTLDSIWHVRATTHHELPQALPTKRKQNCLQARYVILHHHVQQPCIGLVVRF